MKIVGRDQGSVFGDGCFSHPESIFIFGCVCLADMVVYMKKKSGVRIQKLGYT